MKWTSILYAYGEYQQLGAYNNLSDAKFSIESTIGKRMKSKKINNEEYELDGRHLAITIGMAKRSGYNNLKEDIHMKDNTIRTLQLNSLLNENIELDEMGNPITAIQKARSLSKRKKQWRSGRPSEDYVDDADKNMGPRPHTRYTAERHKQRELYGESTNRIIKISQYLNEATKGKYEIHHESFTSAVREALDYASKNGYEVDEHDWFNNIAVGKGRPKNGQTFVTSIGLEKDGKAVRKMLQIQVYDRQTTNKNYELNCYIS